MEEGCRVPAIAVHGGAWAIPDDLKAGSCKGVERAVRVGYKVLEDGGTSVDAVEAAVRALEDDPVFDAGESPSHYQWRIHQYIIAKKGGGGGG